ncbi:MAG: protein-tyrosine-phosphatase [Saprospiraceae bacterium]|jgi:protein-tyrosine-phosphatase
MNTILSKSRISIWGLALGYFLFYVPYSTLTKALSKGLLPGSNGTISGFEMLPTVVIGTFLMLLFLITILGWWKYAGYQKILGLNIPFATNKWTFFSGIATAFIIITTTLAYSFAGVSIVFAALLMRGGVLVLAPFVDKIYGRKVHWYSWAALGLSLIALVVIFMEKGGFALTLIAGLNIAAYLSGYFFRLQFMTYLAKTREKQVTYQFFVEEMLVAAYAIIAIPAILALFGLMGSGGILSDLQLGFRGFISSAMAIPALLIGALYACLYIFGSRIYLDHRENTFCIPINRCASLLAGVVAAFVLSAFFEGIFVSAAQLMSAGILLTAILFLSVPFFQQYISGGRIPSIVYLFVCPGNTGRSPMAQAICIAHLKMMMIAQGRIWDEDYIKVMSAGFSVKEGAAMAPNAQLALEKLGVEKHDHQARNLKVAMVSAATEIFCMSEEHQQEIIGKFPGALNKVSCLDPGDNITIPHGGGVDAYHECAATLKNLINNRFEKGHIS